MPLYSAVVEGVSVSAAQDIFELSAAATTRVLVREVLISQYSDFGDAQDELLSVRLIRGHTTSGSGGTSVTPGQFDPYGRVAASAVERNNTTVASSGTGVSLASDAFNVRAGWFWRAQNYATGQTNSDYSIILKPSDIFVVRVTVPADAITLNATLVFEEIGKMPVS